MWHICVAYRPVTGYAIAADHGNDRRLGARVVGGGSGEEKASDSIVTGGAGIMNFVIASAQRDAGGRTGGCRMAASAFR